MWCVAVIVACIFTLCVLSQEPKNYVCDEIYSTFQKLANQEAKLASLESKVAELESALSGAKANAECRHVAFRVTLTKTLGKVQPGQTIIYDNVELNIGKAFHPHHGVFTAPCNGTYLFSMKMGNINKAGALHLKVNDVTVEYAWAGFNSGWDMGGVTTVVYLVVGDDVWVEGRDIIEGTDRSDDIGKLKHVGFSGTLLHAF